MKSLLIISIIFLNIQKYQCKQLSCRTNCSTNGTIDHQCWHDALKYRSSELIERLFSFSSLSVYVDTYQREHSTKLNNSIELISKSLDNHLLNESINARLNTNLFTETKDLLIEFCQNLTSTPIETVRQLPSLSCSVSSCSSDTMNYMVLAIISIITSSLVFIICIVQSIRSHRTLTTSLIITANPQNTPLLNSLSTTNTSVNT